MSSTLPLLPAEGHKYGVIHLMPPHILYYQSRGDYAQKVGKPCPAPNYNYDQQTWLDSKVAASPEKYPRILTYQLLATSEAGVVLTRPVSELDLTVEQQAFYADAGVLEAPYLEMVSLPKARVVTVNIAYDEANANPAEWILRAPLPHPCRDLRPNEALLATPFSVQVTDIDLWRKLNPQNAVRDPRLAEILTIVKEIRARV